METLIILLQILTVAGLGAAMLFPQQFFGRYLAKKGENLATKEDIGHITEAVESVKAKIGHEQAVLHAKYQMKHEACLEALALIDSLFSQILRFPNGESPALERRSTAEARRCHNKIILACDNVKILDKFAEIFFVNSVGTPSIRPPTDLLNEFRQLVRLELGFGASSPTDPDRAWFGTFPGDEKPTL